MGIPVYIWTGIAKIFAYGDPRSHNEIVHILGATPPPASALGSPSAPAGLTATVEAGDESSTDSFRWDGDDEGADFKPNGSVSM